MESFTDPPPISMDVLKLGLALLVICALCHGSEGSIKKGVALYRGYAKCEDFQVLNNIAWWYDYRMDVSVFRNKFTCTGVDQILNTYVPMVWSFNALHEGNLTIENEAVAVLGFNEPNHLAQSNMSGADAAILWKTVQEQSRGKPLVSPAAAPCGGPSCGSNINAWFDEFFKHCSGCKVDYLATHIYSCDPDGIMSFLEGLFHRYGKKIWLTEFACPYTKDPHRQLRLLKHLLPRLEAAPYVYRYAWYEARILTEGFVQPSASFFEGVSSRLTELGRYYNNFQGSTAGSVIG